jgi:hypothetical protein
MPDLTNNPGASGTDQQRRVWRLYEAGRLTANQATTKLLRLRLDESPEEFRGSPIIKYVDPVPSPTSRHDQPSLMPRRSSSSAA